TSGLWVTLVSTFLFTLVSYLTIPKYGPIQANRFLLRYIDLLVLGYMIAYWGGSEVKLRKRLRLLKEVSLLSNPRFGVDQTINSVIESIRSFYAADTCCLVFVARSGAEGQYRLHRVDRKKQTGNAPTEITEDIARLFLSPSPTQAAIYRKRRLTKMLFYDTRTGQLSKGEPGDCKLYNPFEGKSFLTVPVYNYNQMLGRLYVAGGKSLFDSSEIDFVLQIIEQVVPVLENIRLVDRLASEAAEQERRKIAQDIHDSVIQPYIGLQFGLEAVRQKLLGGNGDVMNEVKDLLELTNGEIDDLRRYVGGLRHGESSYDTFLPAVQRFASKFSEATGIQIEVSASGDLPIYDRLAAELFRMIEEGLSNIRRHSNSRYAKVEISRKNGDLLMELKNHRPKNSAKVSFTPCSISERAAALGGQAFVYTDRNNDTVVSVQIPL
ncbi:MAG: sensor histidine kinase, partial [Pyrinomonadaceae bacterium]